MLMLLMSMALSGGSPTPPPATVGGPPVGGGIPFLGHIPKTGERAEQIRRDRVRFGIIPDNVPEVAARIIEEQVAAQLETLSRDEADQLAELKLAFHVERMRWKEAYAAYYKAYVDALVTEELKDRYGRRKRLMVFILMNS